MPTPTIKVLVCVSSRSSFLVGPPDRCKTHTQHSKKDFSALQLEETFTDSFEIFCCFFTFMAGALRQLTKLKLLVQRVEPYLTTYFSLSSEAGGIRPDYQIPNMETRNSWAAECSQCDALSGVPDSFCIVLLS